MARAYSLDLRRRVVEAIKGGLSTCTVDLSWQDDEDRKGKAGGVLRRLNLSRRAATLLGVGFLLYPKAGCFHPASA
jgi:hypothetical protein